MNYNQILYKVNENTRKKVSDEYNKIYNSVKLPQDYNGSVNKIDSILNDKNIKIDEKVIKDVFYYKYNQNISLKNYGYLDNKIIRFDEKTTNKYYSIMKDHLVFDKEIELIDLYYGFNSDIWYIDESHKIHNKTYKIQKCVKNLRIF